jgi:hypothetical protein
MTTMTPQNPHHGQQLTNSSSSNVTKQTAPVTVLPFAVFLEHEKGLFH